MVVAALLALPVGLVVLRRLRSDYQAIAMLVLSVIASLMVTNTPRFLDGAAGLSLVPQPLSDRLNPYADSYLWLYSAVTLVLLRLVLLVVAADRRTRRTGVRLRALREHELAANALGKNSVALKLTDLRGRRRHRRAERRHPGGLHHHLGAVDVAVPGDAHPLRGGHRRRPRQQLRRGPRRAAGAGRLRGGDPLTCRRSGRRASSRRSSGCASPG